LSNQAVPVVVPENIPTRAAIVSSADPAPSQPESSFPAAGADRIILGIVSKAVAALSASHGYPRDGLHGASCTPSGAAS
jgi:hypothetical protein